MAHRVARLTRNVEVVGSCPIKGLEQETLPLLLSWLVPGTDLSVMSQSN